MKNAFEMNFRLPLPSLILETRADETLTNQNACGISFIPRNPTKLLRGAPCCATLTYVELDQPESP